MWLRILLLACMIAEVGCGALPTAGVPANGPGVDTAVADVPGVETVRSPTPVDARLDAGVDRGVSFDAPAVFDLLPPGRVDAAERGADQTSWVQRLCGATRSAPGLTLFPRLGNAQDMAMPPRGPGLILMGGGTDVDAAFVWMHDLVAGGRDGNGGDVVVLRASGTEAYDPYLQRLATFNSVRTILVSTTATPDDLAAAATHVDCAEAVFFAGGDQADYVRWNRSALMAAVQGVWDRGGVVGGTSAGLAILGQFVYDARAGSVITAEAVANPFRSDVTFTRDMLAFAPLAGVITDTHFVVRDRLGRLAAFLARLQADGAMASAGRLFAVGVDERAAIVIDSNGMGTLLGAGTAYVVRGGTPTRVAAGMPLQYPNLAVTRLAAGGPGFDFRRGCGVGPTYSVSVDGALTPPYMPANPYTVTGQPGAACP